MKYIVKEIGDKEDEEMLWRKYDLDRSIKNRNNLVTHYLPLLSGPVLSVYPICRNSSELNDIFQSAVIGLIESVENYSPESGASFKTYSKLRIHGSIIDYLRKSSLIRVPYYARKKIEEEKSESETENAKYDASSLAPQLISLDELGNDSENGDYIANLLVDLSDSVEDIVTDRIMSEKVARLLETLPVDEYSVISLYYFKNKTLNEIAAKLSMSRAGVWQLRGRALNKLRKMLGVNQK